MNAKKATFEILDHYALEPRRRFSGYGITRQVMEYTGDIHYPATILRYMREWRRDPANKPVKNVDKKKSLYEVGV